MCHAHGCCPMRQWATGAFAIDVLDSKCHTEHQVSYLLTAPKDTGAAPALVAVRMKPPSPLPSLPSRTSLTPPIWPFLMALGEGGFALCGRLRAIL